MTIGFRESTHCPHCLREHAADTGFGRWIRRQKGMLDSANGVCVLDIDAFIIHRYAVPRHGSLDRAIQYAFFVEVKTFGRDLTPPQRDTLSMFDQLMRNVDAPERKPLFSEWQGCRVEVICFGAYLLRMDQGCPHESRSILWGDRQIDERTLHRICSSEINPDTLEPIEVLA